MKKIIVCICASLFTILIHAQEAKGIVFQDENGNGEIDSNEKGLSNVAVTNGKEVVVTDFEGKYRLPIGQDDIIAVIKPSGYKVAINENMLPQFFYRHKPEGSPEMRFKGVDATGKLPKSIDFGLVSSKEKNEFTTIIFGDPQPYTQMEVDHFTAGIVNELEGGLENVPFGLSLGDLVGNDLDLFNPYINAVQRIGIPWYNVLGNHDLNFDVENDQMSDETFEDHFGPANYAFNYGKVHFIVLDDILYPDPRDGKGYWAGFREDQLKFIENDLKHVPQDHLVVLAFHIPLSNSFRTEDREKLFGLLEDYPNTLSLSAHTHRQNQEFFGKDQGWQQEKLHHHYNVGTTSGDWYSGKLDKNGVPISTMRDGTPKGYAFINFKGNAYDIDYKVAGKPEDYRMKIFAPKVVAKGRKTQAGIFVNFFMGSENDEMMYRINDGGWKKMDYVEEFDPSYVESVYEWDLAEQLMPGRRGSNPVRSKHLWKGNVPTDLDVGDHTIEIKVIDMFGREFIETDSYRLENPK